MNGRARTTTAAVIVAALCAACIPHRLKETPQLSGTVTDARTALPIVGARLHYERFPNRMVASETDGRFAFPAIRRWILVPLGPPAPMIAAPPQRLVVEASGYRTQSLELMPLEDRELAIRLSPR